MAECNLCGALVDERDVTCRYCGNKLIQGGNPPVEELAPQPEPEPTPQQEPQQPQARQQTYESQTRRQTNNGPYGKQGGNAPYGQQRSQQPHYGQGYAPPPGQQGYQAQGGNQQQGYQPSGGPGPYYNQGTQGQYTQQPPMYNGYRNINKIAAGLFGIFLGSFGVHKFYMGKIGLGILYAVFFWTSIPGIVGFIEGIIYLCTDDRTFMEKYARLP